MKLKRKTAGGGAAQMLISGGNVTWPVWTAALSLAAVERLVPLTSVIEKDMATLGLTSLEWDNE